MKLIVPITNDPITGNPREAEVVELKFNKDWEIEILIDIFEKNNQGQRLFDLASQLSNELQRNAMQQKHFPTRQRYTTIDSFVNEQGQVVANGEIKEIDYLNSINFVTLKSILSLSDVDSVLAAIKQFVGLQVQNISQRGQN